MAISNLCYWLRVVGTNYEPTGSTEADRFANMITNTTATGGSPTRWEIELAVLIAEPTHPRVGDTREYPLLGDIRKPRLSRTRYEVTMFPVSTIHGTDYPQTSEQLEYLEQVIAIKRNIWIAAPVISGHALPPRWADSTNFPKLAALLPRQVEMDEPQRSVVEDEAIEEVTITFDSKRLI